MGRDNTGKKQEEETLRANQAKETADRAERDRISKKQDEAVAGLEANPGLGDDFLSAERSRNAGLIGGAYDDAGDQLLRTSATEGHSADDVGLAPNLATMARDKSTMATNANLDQVAKDAQARLDTRRLVPSLYTPMAGLYSGSANNIGGQNTNLIDSRVKADQTPTFMQQLALAGVQGAAQVGSAAAGKPPCWIAEALWGVDDERTHLIRYWITNIYGKSFIGSLVLRAYVRFGQAVAEQVRQRAWVEALFRPIFDAGLRRATREVSFTSSRALPV